MEMDAELIQMLESAHEDIKIVCITVCSITYVQKVK